MSEVWWTEDRITELTQRWNRGETGTQIMRAMGATSRSAVVGKAYRLKLPSHRANYTPPKRKRRKRIRMLKIKSIAPTNGYLVLGEQIEMVEEETPNFENAETFFELAADECRWPGQEAGIYQLKFCAAPVERGYSYCAGHCRMAFAKPGSYRAPRL